MKYTVAVLTMSSKNGGYCVAGVDVKNGNWIRLVSDNVYTHGALSSNNIKYQNGSSCKPLDVVQVPIIGATPLEYQPENVLIDTKECWEKIDTISLKDILKIHPLEYHAVLLGNQYPYITNAGIGKVGHSLILVEVTDLTINHQNERSTKATFTYYDTQYIDISVTDPDYYYVQNQWHTDNAILVMSLPDSPYNGNYYYKFVAKIFPYNNSEISRDT